MHKYLGYVVNVKKGHAKQCNPMGRGAEFAEGRAGGSNKAVESGPDGTTPAVIKGNIIQFRSSEIGIEAMCGITENMRRMYV
jgi:hypothetical protein